MSPEALRSNALSGASDIYSLGISMWQLQTRRVPYHLLDCNETIAYQVVKHELRPDSYAEMRNLARDYSARDTPIGCDCTPNNLNGNTGDVSRRRATVRRNLSCDPSYTADRDLKKKERRQNRLALHFECPAPAEATATSACLENAYTKLYKSCWVSAPESRLASGQLKHELEHILSSAVPSLSDHRSCSSSLVCILTH